MKKLYYSLFSLLLASVVFTPAIALGLTLVPDTGVNLSIINMTEGGDLCGYQCGFSIFDSLGALIVWGHDGVPVNYPQTLDQIFTGTTLTAGSYTLAQYDWDGSVRFSCMGGSYPTLADCIAGGAYVTTSDFTITGGTPTPTPTASPTPTPTASPTPTPTPTMGYNTFLGDHPIDMPKFVASVSVASVGMFNDGLPIALVVIGIALGLMVLDWAIGKFTGQTVMERVRRRKKRYDYD
jgi:hypothetical protein